MTIKQLGGVFGRNPTFNEVDVTGKVTSGSLTVDTDTLYVDNVNRRVGFGTTSPGARIEATASGAPVQILNRTASDGSIIDLERGGVSVGLVGAQGSKTYIGTGDAGLLFDNANNRVDPCWPTNVGGTTNGALDLGGSTTRFKNLYLSGGVYLGGTAAANLLDDYEEGTWTPVLSDGTNNATMGSAAGSYTKIGRQVFCKCRVVTTALGSVSGGIRVTGLPFTVAAGSGLENLAGGVASQGSGLAIILGSSISISPQQNTTRALLYVWDDVAGTTAMQATEWTDDGNAYFEFSYFV